MLQTVINLSLQIQFIRLKSSFEGNPRFQMMKKMGCDIRNLEDHFSTIANVGKAP